MTQITPDKLVKESDEPIVIHDMDGVRIIIFNRPKTRNAVTREMRKQFAQIMLEASEDPFVKTIILTGAGNAFSAGVDIKETRSEGPGPLVRPNPAEVVRRSQKPVIAAVDGPCVTGALEIALSCSFIIATEEATFADTHAKVGLFPAWGLSALLPRAIGPRRAYQMSMTGTFIPAHTAYEWGMVNEIVPRDAVLQRCLEIAFEISNCESRSQTYQRDVFKKNEALALNQALKAEETTLELFRRTKT